MDYFTRRDGQLHAEAAPLASLAETFGTPLYVYSQSTISRHVKVFSEALGSLPHLLCYAVKANANLAILQLMQQLGCGFDAVSGGELSRVLTAGGHAHNTILSGVGKTDEEITQALAAGARYICVESSEELWAVRDIARNMQRQAPVAIRVNPDVDARTHPYISTGLKENKFGVPMAEAGPLFLAGHQDPHLNMVGASCHIGSQITTLSPFVDAAHRITELVQTLLQQGVALSHIGMGGGLGVPYHTEQPPDPASYGRALAGILGPLGLHVILEPGRVLVGNAGVLVTRVVRCKNQSGRRFVIVDAGMNDLLRPALYGAYHGIEPVMDTAANREGALAQDIVGPVCESADTFAKARMMAPLQAQDLVAIRTVGAYGFAMAGNYNGRRRPAEVLVCDARSQLIREREQTKQLWQGEFGLDGHAF